MRPEVYAGSPGDCPERCGAHIEAADLTVFMPLGRALTCRGRIPLPPLCGPVFLRGGRTAGCGLFVRAADSGVVGSDDAALPGLRLRYRGGAVYLVLGCLTIFPGFVAGRKPSIRSDLTSIAAVATAGYSAASNRRLRKTRERRALLRRNTILCMRSTCCVTVR